MYEEETVFILGAGASWHYGYPTGEELNQLVKDAAVNLKIICEGLKGETSLMGVPPKYFLHLNPDPFEGLNQFLSECDLLKNTLNQVNPLVIDYFLHDHPSLQNIGKLLISYVLLEAEKIFKKHDGNINQRKLLDNSPDRETRARAQHLDVKRCKDDWLRYILYNLVANCEDQEDLLKNKISFITFNYDVSLENRIYRGLASNERIFNDDRGKFYGDKDLVLHVYGSIRKEPFEDTQFGDFQLLDRTFGPHNSQKAQDTKICLDKAWEAAQGIFTIPEQKLANKKVLEIAKAKISTAKTIYILGYGFDPINCALIELARIQASKENKRKRKVYFTNYLDSNRINKASGL